MSNTRSHVITRWAFWLIAIVVCVPSISIGDDSPIPPFPNPIPIPTSQPAQGAALPTGAHAAVIKIEGVIYGYHLESLRVRIDQAIRDGASMIVVEIDTPGGLLDSALRISKYLKTVPVPTVAWINPEAYSAGILIAASCQRIVMAPVSATGDCAPIIPGQNLSPTERAKALSPLLEEFRDSADHHGHAYTLFHAMCVLGIEVYQIKHPATGTIRLVNQEDYAVMVKGASVDGTLLGKVLPQGFGGRGGVGSATITVATEADRGRWELVKKIHDGKTLLTLNQTRAVDVGLAAGIARDTTELQQVLGASRVTVWAPSRIVLAAYWMTRPWLRAILIVVMLLAGFVELQAPGLGIPGAVAAGCLVILLGAPYLVGIAQLWHVVLFGVGVLLLLLELFVIPGFGIAGIGGIVCMFTGLVLMVVPTSGQGWVPLPAPDAQMLRESVLYTILSFIVSFVGFFFLVKHFGNIPFLNRLVLENTTPGPARGAYANGPGPQWLKVGLVGKSITVLRPSGTAEINGQIIDVTSSGDWIDLGQPVRVIEVHGNRVVVDVVQE